MNVLSTLVHFQFTFSIAVSFCHESVEVMKLSRASYFGEMAVEQILFTWNIGLSCSVVMSVNISDRHVLHGVS